MMLHPLNQSVPEDSGIVTVFSLLPGALPPTQPKQLLMPLLSLMREGRMKRGEMRDGQRGEVWSKQTETVFAA